MFSDVETLYCSSATTHQLLEFLLYSFITHDTMICFNHVEVVISRVRDEFARRVSQRHRILLELGAKLRDLEDPMEYVLDKIHEGRDLQKKRSSVGTIGTIEKAFRHKRGASRSQIFILAKKNRKTSSPEDATRDANQTLRT